MPGTGTAEGCRSSKGPVPSVGFRGRRPEARHGEKLAARSSVKLSSSANDNLIDRTVALWQRRLGRDLTRENAREIVENVAGFFNTLAKWQQAEISRSANDNMLPAVHAGEIETCCAKAIRPGGEVESP